MTCFHHAFLLQNKRFKSPLKTRKTAKTIGGVFKNKLSPDMKKSFRGEVQGSILSGFGGPFWAMLGIIASFFSIFLSVEILIEK